MSPGRPAAGFDTFEPCSIPIDASKLPPLLPIADKELLTQSLSHQSHFIHGEHPPVITNDELAHEKASWKALEYRGDAVLSHYLCEVIRRTWPDVTALALDVSLPEQHLRCHHLLTPFAPLGQSIRRVFLTNQVFATLAKHYGFQDRILISPLESMQGLLDNTSVLADSWEAYIGALDIEAWRSGRQAGLLEWLCQVFSERVFPTIREVGIAKEANMIRKRASAKQKREMEREKQAAKRSAGRVDGNLPRPDSKRQRLDNASGSVLSPVSLFVSCMRGRRYLRHTLTTLTRSAKRAPRTSPKKSLPPMASPRTPPPQPTSRRLSSSSPALIALFPGSHLDRISPRHTFLPPPRPGTSNGSAIRQRAKSTKRHFHFLVPSCVRCSARSNTLCRSSCHDLASPSSRSTPTSRLCFCAFRARTTWSSSCHPRRVTQLPSTVIGSPRRRHPQPTRSCFAPRTTSVYDPDHSCF